MLGWIIGYALVAAVFSFASILYADKSVEEFYGKERAGIGWYEVIFILINAGFCIGGCTAVDPGAYVFPLVLLAILHLLNKEGKWRRASWNTLVWLYAIAIVVTLARKWDADGRITPQAADIWQLVRYVILVAAVLIIGAVHTNRLENGTAKKEKQKTGNVDRKALVVSYTTIAVLAAALVFIVVKFL